MTHAPARHPSSHFRLSRYPRHPLASSGHIAYSRRHHPHHHHHHTFASSVATRTATTCFVTTTCAATSPLLPLRNRCIYQLTRLLCILLLLTMVGGRCLASPWIEENGDSVNLRAQFCKPVSEDHLRSMLGEAFDPSRMITEDMAAAKRADPSRLGHPTDDVEDRSAVDPYYQEDEPDRDLDEIVDVDAGWQEDMKDEVIDIEEDEEKDLKSEASLFKKEHEMESALADSTDVDRLKLNKQAEPTAGQLSSLLSYMKRRRRASSDEQVPPEATDDILGKVNKKNDSSLPLRLFLTGKNKKNLHES